MNEEEEKDYKKIRRDKLNQKKNKDKFRGEKKTKLFGKGRQGKWKYEG